MIRCHDVRGLDRAVDSPVQIHCGSAAGVVFGCGQAGDGADRDGCGRGNSRTVFVTVITSAGGASGAGIGAAADDGLIANEIAGATKALAVLPKRTRVSAATPTIRDTVVTTASSWRCASFAETIHRVACAVSSAAAHAAVIGPGHSAAHLSAAVGLAGVSALWRRRGSRHSRRRRYSAWRRIWDRRGGVIRRNVSRTRVL